MELVEVEGEDGSKLVLGENESGIAVVWGRGCGFNTNDRTVSRRHVSFQLNKNDSESAPRVSFEVIGRNPVWVCTNNNNDDGAIRVCRRSEKGELEFGDRFCLSAKAPVWFHLKKPTQLQLQLQEEGNKFEKNEQEDQVAVADADSNSPGDLSCDDAFDVSRIDPVREFGFVVMGHEFDHYPKGMIRNVKDWEWFLEEPSKDSEEDEDYFGKERRGKMRRKRKKGENNEDDEWTGEREDDKYLVANLGKRRKLGYYSTRSKDSKKAPNRDTKGSTNSKRKKVASVHETVEDEEEEDDETLGGFIVDDEEDQEEENNEDEEEEFEEEDDSGVEED